MTLSLHPITDAFKCSKMRKGQEAAVGDIMAKLEAITHPKPVRRPDSTSEDKLEMVEKIAAIVRARPGITYAELAIAADTGLKAVSTHCYSLRQAERAVTVFRISGRKRVGYVYPANYSLAFEPHVEEPSPITEIVMAHITENPGLSYAQLSRNLSLKPESIKYHCTALRNAGRIVTRMALIDGPGHLRFHGVVHPAQVQP